jgi:hypothetical protein
MTGATFGCLLNRSEWWYGPVLDGGEVVQWLDVTWTALTPPGTSVQVSWSVDGVSWNAATSAQAILGAVGQFFQVRALMTTTNAAVPSLDTLQVRWQH